MIVNGHDLTRILRVGRNIRGRGPRGQENEYISPPGMDGEWLSSSRKRGRSLEIPISIWGDTPEDIIPKVDQLNEYLDFQEPKPIILPGEPNKIYYGLLDGEQAWDEIGTFGKGILHFYCPDPYKYGPELTATFPADAVNVTNYGTAEADPIFEMRVLQPVTFALIQNQDDEYMMIGRPVDHETSEPFEEYEELLRNTMSSTTGWTTHNQVDGGPVEGTIISSQGFFRPSSFGSGSSWHGPALKTSMPGGVHQDFRVEAKIEFINSSNRLGRVEIYLLDAQNVIIGKMGLKDTRSEARAFGEVRVGDNQDNHFLIAEEGDRRGTWNRFEGVIRLERKGNEWHGYIAKVNSSGVHHSRRSVYWTDVENKHTRPVAQIAVHFGQLGSFTPVEMGVELIVAHKINKEPDGVPYIAQPGDIITFDHKEDELLVNGEDRTDLKDFGGSYFKLKKGQNQLVVHPSDSFDTSIKYRERFR